MESTCTAVGQLADNAVGLLAPFGFRQQLRSKAALPRRAAALSGFHRYLAPGGSFAVRRVAALLALRNHEEGIRR